MMKLNNTHQPIYSESIYKFMAREFNIRIYRLFTGNKSVPQEKQYLTLANVQDKSPTSEINQLVTSLLIKPSQFVGIDSSKTIIKKNQKNHPESRMIHGDWNLVLSTNEFNPAMIYLDSTYFGDRQPALKALKNTLEICNHKTLVICNVMETNPRSGAGLSLDASVLARNLHIDELPAKYRHWNRDKEKITVEEIENSLMRIPNYTYKTTDKTVMKSFIFYKGPIPPEEKIEEEYNSFNVWCNNLEKDFNE